MIVTASSSQSMVLRKLTLALAAARPVHGCCTQTATAGASLTGLQRAACSNTESIAAGQSGAMTGIEPVFSWGRCTENVVPLELRGNAGSRRDAKTPFPRQDLLS